MAISYFCPQCGADNTPGDTLCRACQHPLDAPPDVQGNALLLNERYQILAEIGAGGFGAVYKARDTREQGRLVAVKQINLKGLTSQEIIEATDAFNREAQILSDLSHPLLPRIFDRFSDPEHWYLVMNFIDGSTLDEYLQQQAVRSLPARSGLSLAETLTIGLQVCDALHYLHSQQPPVIFRDLKPGNIMRTTSGRLYLIDFGIARRFKPGQAKDTIPFGSPGYAAPEQYGKAQTTPRADIYSLGALLFCLITGDDPSEHPFQFPPLRLYGIDGIRELDALIQRMVALDPTRRPADIQEVQAELQHIQRLHAQSSKQSHIWTPPQGQTPPPTPATTSGGQQQIFLTPSGAQPPARKSSRRRVLTVGLLAGGAALVGGVIFLGNQQPQPLPVQSQPADQNGFDTGATADARVQATANAQNEATATAASKIAAVPLNGPAFWSPDLNYAAVVNSEKSQIELYTVQGQKLLHTIQPANFNSNTTVQWSPDNNQILLSTFANNGEVWDVEKMRKVFTLPAFQPNTPSFSWSPNAQYLATGYTDVSNNSVFALFNALNGQQLSQKTFFVQGVTSLAWTPDSRYVLFPVTDFSFSNITGTWIFEIWDSQTRQRVKTLADSTSLDLTASRAFISLLAYSPSARQIAFGYQNLLWLGNVTKPYSFQQLTSLTDGSGFDYQITSLAWSPNGKYIATLYQGNMSIWNISNSQSVQLKSNDSQGSIAAFAWASDSKSITVVDNNNIISHWSVG